LLTVSRLSAVENDVVSDKGREIQTRRPAVKIAALPDGVFSFLLFSAEQPELFDAVRMDEACQVRETEVKRANAREPDDGEISEWSGGRADLR
jgi:hypothetical protein